MKRTKNTVNAWAAGLAFSLLGGVFFSACDSGDDAAPLPDEPTISVLSDNSAPFPEQVVTFTIVADAPGNIASIEVVALDAAAADITQSAGETSANYTFEWTVPTPATFGPTSVTFTVTDEQGQTGTASISLDLRNPETAGEPSLIDNFSNAFPNAEAELFSDNQGSAGWQTCYPFQAAQEDPTNPANLVLEATRNSVTEWGFQGGGALQYVKTSTVAEDDILGLLDGSRVLQMNMHYVPNASRMVAVNQDVHPGAPDINANWTIDYAARAWNYDAQDSVIGIPVLVEVGQNATWDWNGGDPTGKLMFVVGSLTAENEWQTVTFSPMELSDPSDEASDLLPQPADDSGNTFQDPAGGGTDEVDRFAIQLHARVSGFENDGDADGGWDGGASSDPWLETPGDGNGWCSGSACPPISIVDEGSTYYVDNLRVIGAEGVGRNPNN